MGRLGGPLNWRLDRPCLTARCMYMLHRDPVPFYLYGMAIKMSWPSRSVWFTLAALLTHYALALHPWRCLAHLRSPTTHSPLPPRLRSSYSRNSWHILLRVHTECRVYTEPFSPYLLYNLSCRRVLWMSLHLSTVLYIADRPAIHRVNSTIDLNLWNMRSVFVYISWFCFRLRGPLYFSEMFFCCLQHRTEVPEHSFQRAREKLIARKSRKNPRTGDWREYAGFIKVFKNR